MRTRRTTRRDAAALRRFECASDTWYEREVEDYIRRNLAEAVANGRRVIVFDDETEIVALTEHHPEYDPSGSGLVISWLSVVAIRIDRQGSILPTGQRLSDSVLSALISDALMEPGRAPVVAAYVAAENIRSRRICGRAGLVEEPAPDMLFVPTLGESRPYILVSQKFTRIRPPRAR